jgi:gamma-glutamylaminecyclotransferase
MTRIFVYGTLKRGGSNHLLLARQQFLGIAWTPPGYTLYSLGDYPGMVRAPADQAGVEGEVWVVDDACLRQLDDLEGVDQGIYECAAITLAPPFADAPVQTYLYRRDLSGRPVIGSTWKE